MNSARTADDHRSLVDTDFKRSLLHSIALFRDVDHEGVSDLLSQCTRIDIAKGEVLLSPQSKNHCVYVVLGGELTVRVGGADGDKIVDLLPGSCAGEMSLIEDKDPSAYVVAKEDSHLMVISHNLLWHMVERSHTFAKNLLVVLSERVRSDNKFIANSLDVLKQAKHNAITDALTELGNRHWMHEMFERELTRCQRSDTSACLMMIDIDGFKQFNDKYGHTSGDRVLSAVAKALRDHVRPTDLVARFGGDELAAFLPGISLEAALQTAHRVRERMQELSPKSLKQPVTVSIGVAEVTPDDDLGRLIHRADTAMYLAKDKGRNRVESA